MIETFEIVNPGNLFPWELCELKFEMSHPDIFRKFKKDKKDNPKIEDFDYINNLFEMHEIYDCPFSDYPAIWGISKELTSVEVHLFNGCKQSISNLSIIELNHGDEIDADLLISTNRFFILTIKKTSLFGTLGIWDTDLQDWCFANSDECLCIDEIEYYPVDDEFRGVFSYHQSHSPIRGGGEFVIDKSRNFSTKKL
ncbi:hypothetical protein N9Z31_03615 [Pseudomonadales bacterium]|nr:hypothetical protein [Pseudomonadales bacterium]